MFHAAFICMAVQMTVSRQSYQFARAFKYPITYFVKANCRDADVNDKECCHEFLFQFTASWRGQSVAMKILHNFINGQKTISLGTVCD